MTRRTVLALILTVVFIMGSNGTSVALGTQVRDALKNTVVIAYPAKGRSVDHTVAEALKELAPQAKLLAVNDVDELKGEGVFRVAVADEGLTGGPQKYGLQIPGDKEWMFVRLTPSGDGELASSKPHLLYAFFCQIRDQWLGEDVATFTKGRLHTAAFQWLGGDDGIFVFLRQFSVRHYDPESTVKELARLGCSHLSVNGLGVPFSYEEGSPGEIYFRFYNASPDLDQFVETELNKGTYPPEYLRANLNLLKHNAALALKYGLTPGLTICAPRSVPESLLERFPFLRGARVDHTFRSYRPRFTLTLAHPAVRWHYAQMMKQLMREVPELGYVYIWTNDSGSGFEYTLTTYPGRNGGAYLVREWKSEKEIAKVAGENIVRYLRLLRDAASEINPAFRVTFGLGSFPAEGETILQGMNNRLDLQVTLSDRLDAAKWQREQALLKRGSSLLASTSLVSNYVSGVPFPWLAHDRLEQLISAGLDRASITVDAKSLAPQSVNREVVRAFQLGDSANVEKVIEETATRWVGDNYAEALQLLMHEVDAEPNEPYNSLSLAEHFHYYDIDLQRALQHIGLAVAKARADGKFLYQALGVQARLSIETQNWSLLEATLQELASYEHTCGDADVFPETDFLPYIPDGVISQEAIRRYEERVNHLRSIGYSTMPRLVG